MPLARFNMQVPPDPQEVLDQMMAKDVILRYSTPAQAAQGLRAFLTG